MTDISPETIEHIRGWVSTGFLGFLSIIGARFATPLSGYLIRRNELRLQERKDEREGYGPLIDSLTSEVKRISEALVRCQEQHDQDGLRISKLEAEITGYQRSLIARSAHEVMEVPGTAGNVAAKTAAAVQAFPLPEGDS